MSSSPSDQNTSQADSDVHFIERYILEVEEHANVPTTDTVTNDDDWFVQPYQDEPMANAEWIERYLEQRRLEEDRIRKLQSRLGGRTDVGSWCKCGNCSTELLVNAKECQCCQEIDACVEAVNSEQVLLEVDSVPDCITLHPGFIAGCLGVWSLRLAGPKYRKIDRKKYAIKDSENRYLRSISYRQYIQLVYGIVGQRRILLPSCAYHAIRKKFWEEKELTGYEDVEED